MSENFTKLPPELPITIDDGSGDRLLGKNLPDVVLISTFKLLSEEDFELINPDAAFDELPSTRDGYG